MFKKNVGSIDRAARFIFGAGILSLYFLYPDASWRIWTLLGIVPLATALLLTCPAYSIFGISSCSTK